MHGVPTHYEVLGLHPKAQPDQVRKAYRQLARENHPDLSEDSDAHERMAEINLAFETLIDPVRRREYDARIGSASFSEPRMAEGDSRRPGAVRLRVAMRHQQHDAPIYSVAFDRKSGKLASAGFDNRVLWWGSDFRRLASETTLEGGPVADLKLDGEGGFGAAGGSEQRIYGWRRRESEPFHWRKTSPAYNCCSVVSPGARLAAYGFVDRRLIVHRLADGRKLLDREAHKQSVTAAAWSEDGSILATGGTDAEIHLWSASTWKIFRTLIHMRAGVTSIAISPNGRWVAGAGADLSLRIFDMNTGQLHQVFHGHKKPIESLSFHPHSWLLASASRDGSIGLWNIRHGIGHGRIAASHQSLASIRFSPDGKWLAAGGLDRILRVWRMTLPKRA